jgi:DNA polymerase III sliding clamp (beta) subunit (PCNA family)
MANQTRLIVTTDAMKLVADGAGFGVAEDEIEVSYFGAGWQKKFDGQLLAEALGAMSSEEVVLAVNDELMSPMVITPSDESTQRVLLMPMRDE